MISPQVKDIIQTILDFQSDAASADDHDRFKGAVWLASNLLEKDSIEKDDDLSDSEVARAIRLRFADILPQEYLSVRLTQDQHSQLSKAVRDRLADRVPAVAAAAAGAFVRTDELTAIKALGDLLVTWVSGLDPTNRDQVNVIDRGIGALRSLLTRSSAVWKVQNNEDLQADIAYARRALKSVEDVTTELLRTIPNDPSVRESLELLSFSAGDALDAMGPLYDDDSRRRFLPGSLSSEPGA